MPHHAEDWHDERLKEECGVVGLYDPSGDAARTCFFSLFALQHRGQESAGIAVSDEHKVHMYKDMGLVSQVFTEDILGTLPGSLAVGHTRYSTTGSSVRRNAQPIFCTTVVGEIAVAHNGNLINAYELRRELEQEGMKFETTADSELIARLIAEFLPHGIEHAVSETMKRIRGAYSVVVLTPRQIIGFRDPNGIRPMSVGRLNEGWMLASETCAFAPIGGKVERELQPGEGVIIEPTGISYFQAHEPDRPAMCMFEFIYFARPDSQMYGTTLYKARQRMGEELAKEHPVEADIVVPVPDSGIPAAIGYSRESDIPFMEGMTKSRYIHRTFIQPDQRMRELGVAMKLSPIVENIEGKRIILVDDSIVRATTTKQIVKLLFQSGVKEVHVRITAPPIMHPCFYGIDMCSKGELAAARMTIPEICEHVGATSLGYLSVPGVARAVGQAENQFCLACFNGDYPISVPKNVSKAKFEEKADVGQMGAFSSGQFALFESGAEEPVER